MSENLMQPEDSRPPGVGTATDDSRKGFVSELKDILDFTEKENDKHRAYFKNLYTLSAAALTLIGVAAIAAVTYFIAKTRTEVDAEVQRLATNEARAKIADIFSTDKRVQEITLEGVHSYARAELEVVIRQETAKAVQEESGRIREIVSATIDAETRRAIQPVKQDISRLSKQEELTVLMLHAEALESPAFDGLRKIWKETKKEDLRHQLAEGAILEVSNRLKAKTQIKFNVTETATKTSSDQLRDWLTSANQDQRLVALIYLPYKDHDTCREFLSRLIDIAESDESLENRARALEIFNRETRMRFGLARVDDAKAWWLANGGSL